MKRIVLIIIVALLPLMANRAQAQDCKEIVLPHVNYNVAKLSKMPAEKVQWYCNYSKNSFFITDDVPSGSVVYSICDLTFKKTGEHPKDNFVVDLTTLSYYAYNFDEFQYQNYHKTLYFYTPNSTHKYLGVYSISETFKRTDAEVKNKD